MPPPDGTGDASHHLELVDRLAVNVRLMTQNIYDDPGFYAGYSRLPRSLKGLDGAPEWPASRAMLPAMHGRRVLDLGCGFGWFCRWARARGAAYVRGIDVSENMLTRARADTADTAIVYARGDLDHLDLAGERFDLVYSSLALHYISKLEDLFATIHAALPPGGPLVFSVEHPIYTAPTRPGWVEDAAGHKTWPVDAYSVEGPRQTDWLAKGVIKQHRTVATYLTLLLRQGFALSHIDEWSPSDAQAAGNPALRDERRRPMFLLLGVHKTL